MRLVANTRCAVVSGMCTSLSRSTPRLCPSGANTAITRNRMNHVATTIGASATLAEIVCRGTDVGSLAAIWFEGPSRYCKLQYHRFGAGYTMYMRMRSLRINPARTKNVDVAEFVLIDSNTAPTYTAGDR